MGSSPVRLDEKSNYANWIIKSKIFRDCVVKGSPEQGIIKSLQIHFYTVSIVLWGWRNYLSTFYKHRTPYKKF